MTFLIARQSQALIEYEAGCPGEAALVTLLLAVRHEFYMADFVIAVEEAKAERLQRRRASDRATGGDLSNALRLHAAEETGLIRWRLCACGEWHR